VVLEDAAKVGGWTPRHTFLDGSREIQVVKHGNLQMMLLGVTCDPAPRMG
jgi:hypothetical protein